MPVKEDLNGKLVLREGREGEGPMYSQMYFDKNYDYFHIMKYDEETHLVRRRKILEAHPEIRHLFGHDLASLWVAIACLCA